MTQSSSTSGPVENITPAGSATASSTFSSQYPASLATDGDATTSWFSGGSNADGETSQFTWAVEADSTIAQIKIIGNGNDADSATRNGFGFESVTIQVFNAKGTNVFSQDVPLPGTPDPDVVVTPNAVGSVVVLLFNGHENPKCGGFAELEVDAHA